MKQILFLILLSCFWFVAEAQIRKIPATVTNSFSMLYPHATQVEWRDKLQHFEASFQINGSRISADFSSKGEWQSSERIMQYDQLPDEVKDGMQKSRYSLWERNTITEVQLLGRPLEYRINVKKKGLPKKNLFFNVNGKLLKGNIAL